MSNIYISSYTGTGSSFTIPTRVKGSSYAQGFVTDIEASAFENNATLQSVKGDSIEKIGDWAFYNCALTSVSFPNCSYIGEHAFCGVGFTAGSLTTASFPKCSYIGQRAFYQCLDLRTIYFLSTSYITGGSEMFRMTTLTSIYVPASMVNTYKTMQYWSDYASLITAYNG